MRAPGSSAEDASYVELGGDPAQRGYFEREGNDPPSLSSPDFRLPLNLYSDLATRVAIVPTMPVRRPAASSAATAR